MPYTILLVPRATPAPTAARAYPDYAVDLFTSLRTLLVTCVTCLEGLRGRARCVAPRASADAASAAWSWRALAVGRWRGERFGRYRCLTLRYSLLLSVWVDPSAEHSLFMLTSPNRLTSQVIRLAVFQCTRATSSERLGQQPTHG